MSDDALQEILAEILRGNCVVFVGAGLSVGAGLPGWQELISRLAAQFDCAADDHDFLTIAQAYEHKFGRDKLEAVVQECTDTSARTPTETHRALGKLSFRVRYWITTNYDDLLERTFSEMDREPSVVIRESDVAQARNRYNIIVKIHGDSGKPDTIVLTKNDYFASPLAKSLVWNLLADALAQKTFLFLGYSMRDPDFTQLQSALISRVGTDVMRRSYAVIFGPDDIVRRDLASRNIEIVDLGAFDGEAPDRLHRFVVGLVEHLSFFPDIRRKYHKKTEAEGLVPVTVKQQLEDSGYELLGCVEYHVYCSLVDSGQFLTRPPMWLPEVPSAFRKAGYHVIAYTRQDESLNNIWEGIAVGVFTHDH